jgi:hypothetical protein
MSGSQLPDLSRIARALKVWGGPRQLLGQSAFGTAAESNASRTLRPRLEEADKVGTSICPTVLPAARSSCTPGATTSSISKATRVAQHVSSMTIVQRRQFSQ